MALELDRLLSAVFGLDVSLGALSESEQIVSDAGAPAVEEARVHALTEKVKHLDATSWRESGEHRSLSTLATATVTVFTILGNGTRAALMTWIDRVRIVPRTIRLAHAAPVRHDPPMLELSPAGYGFGRLVLDDVGITRSGLIRTCTLAWADVSEYRVAVAAASSIPADERLGVTVLVGGGAMFVVDAIAALRGRLGAAHRFELIGAQRRIMIDARFEHTDLAITEALRRIGPRLRDAARRALASTGRARFGPLTIGVEQIDWVRHPALARRDCVALEVVHGLRRHLVIEARGERRPYARVALELIPNVVTALDLAEELGYPVRGRELLALGSTAV